MEQPEGSQVHQSESQGKLSMTFRFRRLIQIKLMLELLSLRTLHLSIASTANHGRGRLPGLGTPAFAYSCSLDFFGSSHCRPPMCWMHAKPRRVVDLRTCLGSRAGCWVQNLAQEFGTRGWCHISSISVPSSSLSLGPNLIRFTPQNSSFLFSYTCLLSLNSQHFPLHLHVAKEMFQPDQDPLPWWHQKSGKYHKDPSSTAGQHRGMVIIWTTCLQAQPSAGVAALKGSRSPRAFAAWCCGCDSFHSFWATLQLHRFHWSILEYSHIK